MDMDSSFFCDIFILVGSIEDAELQFKLNAINEADSVPGLQHEFVVRYDQIAKVLTGFARIITYLNTSEDLELNPAYYELVKVEEGQFEKGVKKGYCRCISAEDGSCELGFFQQDMPKGKYCKYNLDGSFQIPEGFYDKKSCVQRIAIANYQTSILI